MVNKSRNGLKTKRKRNPLTQQLTRISRPRLNFDGQVLNGTGYFSPIVTITNGASAVYTLDVSNLSGAGILANMYNASLAVDLLAIAKLYNEYIYRSVTISWVPFVAPGVADGASQIYVGYIDNAEEMAGMLSAVTPGTVFNVAKAARNSRFFNAWERFTYNVPLSNRRKSFDTNVNTLQTTDTIDRSTQGSIVVGFSSVSAAASLGQFRVTYKLELRNLNAQITT